MFIYSIRLIAVVAVLTFQRFRLTSHRWVIPANSDVTLRLRFTSTDLGTFDEVCHLIKRDV